MRELIMSVLCSASITALVWETVQCMTVGASGGIPEEAAEDEGTD